MIWLYNKVERLCRMSHSLQKCQGNIFESRSCLILLQGRRMRGASVILVLLVAVPAAYAVDHTVGDSSGWTSGVDYTTWTSGKTFNVNDRLVFTYGASHSVDQVSSSDHDSCSSSNAIQSFSGGNTVFPLPQAGNYYFLCPTAGHCNQGMKLAVTVTAGGGSTPTTPATPGGSPSTPTTPGSTPPNARTPTTPTPAGSGAAGGSADHFSGVLLGASLVVAPLLGLMG